MNSQENTSQEILHRQKAHHRTYLWVPYSLMAIGGWLITGFQPLGYEHEFMIWNDVICGTLLITFGILALHPLRHWPLWAAGFLGVWMCLAPLFSYAPNPAAYTTNTLLGTLVMCFTLVIPNVPGISMVFQKGPNIPPGWSYNPSSWPERIPVVMLGFIGFFTARYLAGYQLGYSDTIFDPLFGDGTRDVLTSDVSKAFPISDAGLGAFTYLLDVIAGLAGSTYRWRTMPWLVVIFGVLVIPLGIVSITLVILQPLAVGAWCSLCLLSALVSVGMIPFTFDEVLATVQFLIKKRKDGHNFWSVFWFGGELDEGEDREYHRTGNEQFAHLFSSSWGELKAKPWNLTLSMLIGLWFMLSPFVFKYEGGFSDSCHFVGALVITFSIISMSEVVRTARFMNILCALWLIASIWLFDHPGGMAMWNGIVSGILLLLLSFRKGKIVDERGGFARYVR